MLRPWATVGRTSGHDDVLAFGAGASGIDGSVLPSCSLPDLSVVALTTAASFGLAARILTGGKGGALLPGPLAADVAAFRPDGAGIECVDAAVAGSDADSTGACCAGWPGARTYQHLR